MTEIKFTQREATFVKRVVKTYAKKFKKDFNEKIEMDYETFIINECIDDVNGAVYIFKNVEGNNDFNVDMKIHIVWDRHERGRPRVESLEPVIVVNHNCVVLGTHKIEDFNVMDYEWVDALIKTYIVCKCCGCDMAVENGFCEECYCLSTTQEDVCCICTENEGVWIKLNCGHTLHRNCFLNINIARIEDKSVRKCPLCREEINAGDDLKII